MHEEFIFFRFNINPAMPDPTVFEALYTRNTQKKHKIWQDAIAKYSGSKIFLYDAESNALLGS